MTQAVIQASHHAGVRMKQRGITSGDVSAVLQNHEVQVVRKDGCTEYVGLVGERRLKVVINEQGSPAILVTAFWQD